MLVPCISAIDWGSHDPDWLEQLTEIMETHLPVYHVVKDVIKDTDEPTVEKICKAKSRSVPSAGASVPVESGYTTILTQ